MSHRRFGVRSRGVTVGAKAVVSTLLFACVTAVSLPGWAAPPGASGAPYQVVPSIAPIGVRVDRYLEVPESARGPEIDPAKGYRIQELGGGLYMLSEGAYQSMFLVYEDGVVVADAPPSYAARILQAIAEVTDRPVTHLIYSHSHIDHIGGARALGDVPVILAHEETGRLLARAGDPQRPLPTVTFGERYTLRVGSKVLELSYHGVAHEPGNIFIQVPAARTLMVVDVVFPGWMPWRRFALAQDVEGYFSQVEEINHLDFDTLVAGHVTRAGTKADVELQLAFMRDLRETATEALRVTKVGEELDPADLSNPWAVYDNYIDRVVAKCVGELTPRWSERLAGFDVYIWDQCYAMEQSLRID
jgi:glyoxylase-like metal-dependent hydrolase (beta-lactamase superfamily II)